MEYVHNSWDKILADQFNAPYFDALMQKVNREYDSSTVYPPKDKIFAALKTVDYDKIKVVIIGQDPYHGEGQANGMAFSVNKGVALPPSLLIFSRKSRTNTAPNLTGALLRAGQNKEFCCLTPS